MFGIPKKPLHSKNLQLDHSKDSMQKLILLTKRMDDTDKKRKRYELFLDAIINRIKPDLLERNVNGCYKFLDNEEVIVALKIALDLVLENNN